MAILLIMIFVTIILIVMELNKDDGYETTRRQMDKDAFAENRERAQRDMWWIQQQQSQQQQMDEQNRLFQEQVQRDQQLRNQEEQDRLTQEQMRRDQEEQQREMQQSMEEQQRQMDQQNQMQQQMFMNQMNNPFF